MKKVIKKSAIKKKQDGGATMLHPVSVGAKPKSMYGGPEVRAKAAARRDSIRSANEAFSKRRAAGLGIENMDDYWKSVKKEAKKPDADRYQGQLNKVNAKGQVIYEGEESPEAKREHCTGSKCGKEQRKAVESGQMKVKSGGTIKKKTMKAKKYQAGGVVSAKSTKKAPDKKGAFITVQKRTLAKGKKK